MAYENIEITDKNFCIGPQSGAYYTLTNVGTHYVVYVKNNNGLLVDTYTITPSNAIDHEVGDCICGFTYIGAVNQLNPANDLLFYSLESIPYIDCVNCGYRLRVGTDILCSQCDSKTVYDTIYLEKHFEMIYYISFIKQWVMDNDLKTFNLESTIEKVSSLVSGTNNYEAIGFAIETIDSEFQDDSNKNTGYINLVTTSGIKKYDTMILGPSSDGNNLNEVEYVNVHSVAEHKVEVTTREAYIPTKNEYDSGDNATIISYIYLMCKSRYIDEQEGYLYKLDPNNYGDILEIDRKYIYNNVDTLIWYKSYKYIAMVFMTQLLFIDPYTNYVYNLSIKLFNLFNDDIHEVYDIDAVGSSFYMLQRKVIKRYDDGSVASFLWETYNYNIEPLIPSSSSVAIVADRRILNLGFTCNITIKVKDQFSIPLVHKNILFTSDTELISFDPLDGVGITDINGEATIKVTLNSYNLNEYITVFVRTDGANTNLGSGYIYNKISLYIYYNKEKAHLLDMRPNYDVNIGYIEDWWPQYSDTIITINNQNQSCLLCLMNNRYYSSALVECCKIRLEDDKDPFGIEEKVITSYLLHYLFICKPTENLNIELSELQDELYLDLLVVSRHFPADVNKAYVNIYQFDFVSEAHPTFYSSKNAYNTYIWIVLRPHVDSLDINTLSFKIKEVSYAGKMDWVDITSELVVNTFGSPPAPLGLEIMWDNTIPFHHSGMVTVFIEVYDTAPIPNRIEISYWFTIVPDYVRPYVINELPARNSTDISIYTNISFDIIDVGAGIDINSVEVYVKGRQVRNLVITDIHSGLHVSFDPEIGFLYSDILDIAVYANDLSENKNPMVDRWVLYCMESIPPWFHDGNFFPKQCSRGTALNTNVNIQVYGVGGGVDLDSIEFSVDESKRDAIITPIIYRIE